MIEIFDRLVSSAMDYIAEQNLCETWARRHKYFYRRLRDYLVDEGLSYSPEVAEGWLQTLDGLTPKVATNYRVAIHKLDDIFLYGKIRTPRHKHEKILKNLNDEFREIHNGFSEWLAEKSHAADSIYGEKYSCDIILTTMQCMGVNAVSELDYGSLTRLISAMDEEPYDRMVKDHASLRLLMSYLFELKLVPYGYTILIDCVTKSKDFPIIRLSEDEATALKKAEENEKTASLDEYLSLCDDLYREHADARYSKGALCSLRAQMDRLYLFMEMHGLRYSPTSADAWLEAIKPQLCENAFKSYRRTVKLVEARFNKTEFVLNSHFTFRNTVFSTLPEWCKPDVEEYLAVKSGEGWRPSTLAMCKSSVCRFCHSIDGMGIRSFADLTASDIKRFNETDAHSTPQGKNAYNSRIRKFLEYLGENGKLSGRYLFLALPSVCARKESLVVVLTDDEQRQLEAAFDKENTDLTLREKAILQLGLYMGLRSCDVLSLAIDDIDWENAEIHVLQDKTSYEIVLPMPTQVANALFRYIMDERPASSDRKIFLRQRAPYRPVGRYACKEAIAHALPMGDGRRIGFHTTRKTFATNLLRNGAGVQEVSEALGHQDLNNVHKYLYLDEDKMRRCPFSLEEKGLTFEGEF